MLQHHRFADAESMLTDAHTGLVSRFPPTHPYVTNTLRALVRLYADWDAAEPQAGHAAKAQRWQLMLDQPAS